MRSILAEAHAVLPPLEDGPFYVVYYRGEFALYPFGQYASQRFNYRIDPVFDETGGPSPYWVFTVCGRGNPITAGP